MSDYEDLLGRILAGPLPPPDVARMSEIATLPSQVDELVGVAIVDDLLRRRSEARRGTARALSLLDDLLDRTTNATNMPARGTVANSRSATDRRAAVGRLALPAALAAAVLSAMVLGWSGGFDGISSRLELTGKSAPLPGAPVARFSRSVNVEWAANAHRWSVGDILAAGDELALTAGRAELVFDSGAVMTVVGPVALEIHSATAVALHNGTATTRVENADAGEFRVLTPTTNVVDLGTEFGVRVDLHGKTDVVVFDGAVDLRPATSAPGAELASRRLTTGEAVRGAVAGSWERLVSVENDAFPIGDRVFDITRTRRPVITGVTDDLRPASSPKYYQVFHEGFREDVRAFVDRPYEWNGIGAEGIPHFLRGADYIATFMANKVDPINIEVELSGPATLYIFYDNRIVVPAWLSEGFENTGFEIGLDEAKYGGKELGIGAGNSIDQTCSVWRRRVEQAGVVKLGPVGPPIVGPGGRTMYGIAAQPL